MPIHIRRREKNNIPTQESDISLFMSDEISFPLASYTANSAVFGFLYRYIYKHCWALGARGHM